MWCFDLTVLVLYIQYSGLYGLDGDNKSWLQSVLRKRNAIEFVVLKKTNMPEGLRVLFYKHGHRGGLRK